MSRTFETDVSLPSVTPSNRSQEIRFCKTADRVTIAYAVLGTDYRSCEPHIGCRISSTIGKARCGGIGSTPFRKKRCSFRYDERGTGLSDWVAEDISFTAMIADLESVVGAAGLDRFTLLGVSQSCAVSVAYAVQHPERVSGLILYGGFVKAGASEATVMR